MNRTLRDKYINLFTDYGMQKRPAELQEKIFNKLFETAEISKLTREEYDSYEGSLKYYRDMTNVVDTAKNEGLIEGEKLGIEKGRKDEKIVIAKNLLDVLDDNTIAAKTGLTVKEIEAIRRK